MASKSKSRSKTKPKSKVKVKAKARTRARSKAAPSRAAAKVTSRVRSSAGARMPRTTVKMEAVVEAVPSRYGTATPHLVIRGCSEAIAFYEKALGACEVTRMPGPDGRLMHAEIQVGDSIIMMSDEFPEMGSRGPRSLGGCHGGVMLYVPDCDAVFAQAVAAGATAKMPPTDMFWGDRYAKVEDPFGHLWGIATHVRDMSGDEIRQAQEGHMASPGGAG